MPKHANDNAEHIIVEELPDGREVAVRAPLPEPTPERMVGPERGAWEDFRRAVASGSVRDEVRALGALHASILGGATRGRRAA